jgi:hypothetical protein
VLTEASFTTEKALRSRAAVQQSQLPYVVEQQLAQSFCPTGLRVSPKGSFASKTARCLGLASEPPYSLLLALLRKAGKSYSAA